MSSQQREILVSLVSALVSFLIYLYYMNAMQIAGDFSGADASANLGKSMFYLIGLSIAVTIGFTILMAIANSIITGENEKDLVDERDRLIRLRGLQVSFATFSAGFLVVMAAMAWWGVQPLKVIFLIICVSFFSSITGDIAKLFHYHRGV